MDVNDDQPSEESNPEMVQVDLDEGMGAVIIIFSLLLLVESLRNKTEVV